MLKKSVITNSYTIVQQSLSNDNDYLENDSSNDDYSDEQFFKDKKFIREWLLKNYEFFVACLNGSVKEWAQTRNIEPNFAKFNIALIDFKNNLTKTFTKFETFDIRGITELFNKGQRGDEDNENDQEDIKHNPDPWICFYRGVLALRPEPIFETLPNRLIPQDSENLLDAFLTRNTHITECLTENFPKLDAVADEWSMHQFAVRQEICAHQFFASIKRNRASELDSAHVIETTARKRRVEQDKKNPIISHEYKPTSIYN